MREPFVSGVPEIIDLLTRDFPNARLGFKLKFSASTAAISAVIAGSDVSVGLNKAGSGALTLSGANTFSGGVTLNAGTLNVNSTSALGLTTSAFVINGSTINNTSASAVTLGVNKTQNWNGDFTFTGTQDLNFGTGNVTLGGTAGQRTVTVSARTLAVGSIPDATTGYGLTKAGPGTLSLIGSSSSSMRNGSRCFLYEL